MCPSWLMEVEGSQWSVAWAPTISMRCYHRATLPPLSDMCQCHILTCQSIVLVGLDGDHALGPGIFIVAEVVWMTAINFRRKVLPRM
jgi:hypothetical protein